MKLKKPQSQKRKNQNVTRKKRILKSKTIRNKKNQKRRRPTKKRIKNRSRNSNKIMKGGNGETANENVIILDSIQEDEDGTIIWLKMQGIEVVKDLLKLENKKLTIPPNSCYMMSNKETKWPYAEEFLTIVRDQNGIYHLFNFNVFVDCEEAFNKGRDCKGVKNEKLNYVFQDTFPCITGEQWGEIVNGLKMKSHLTNLDDYKDVATSLPALSWNQAWQLVRYFEISKYRASCLQGTDSVKTKINKFLENKDEMAPPKVNDWDWGKFNDPKQLNELKELKQKCSKYQTEIIYNGLVKNLSKYGVVNLVDLKSMRFIVGRVDGKYAGRISLNFCHPNKYEKFSEDMKRFKNGRENGREYVNLEGKNPHLFDVSEEDFKVAEDVFLNAPKNDEKEDFFNPKAEAFKNFIFSDEFSGKLKRRKPNVIIIGANSNGESYTRIINAKAKELNVSGDVVVSDDQPVDQVEFEKQFAEMMDINNTIQN